MSWFNDLNFILFIFSSRNTPEILWHVDDRNRNNNNDDDNDRSGFCGCFYLNLNWIFHFCKQWWYDYGFLLANYFISSIFCIQSIPCQIELMKIVVNGNNLVLRTTTKFLWICMYMTFKNEHQIFNHIKNTGTLLKSKQ